LGVVAGLFHSYRSPLVASILIFGALLLCYLAFYPPGRAAGPGKP
jgi:hypothetical protein